MPRFLDVHSMSGLDEDILKKPQNSPLDAFHVKQVNILYNLEADKCFCLLEAPTKEPIEKHHEKMGFKREWITEVMTTLVKYIPDY